MRSRRGKVPIAAFSARAALSPGLVASGCGRDGSAEGSADLTNRGVIYISYVDQPVTVWAVDVDPFNWQQGGPQDESGRTERYLPILIESA